MHGPLNVKFIGAKKTKETYQNIKRKPHKANATIWYHKIWRQKQLTPKYTGCNRRNGPDFGRVFLRSNYTDITQNTYIQS